jgi:toxin ParE1/3/4
VSLAESPWTVHVSDAAKADLKDIQRWTLMQFGERQARLYEQTLYLAIDALKAGGKIAGARARDDISRGLFTLHVARNGRRGRHVLIFKMRRDGEWELVRVLHDSMDFTRHVADERDN